MAKKIRKTHNFPKVDTHQSHNPSSPYRRKGGGIWEAIRRLLHCQEQSILPCTRLQISFTAEPIQIRVELRVTLSVASATCKDPQTGTFSADRNSCSPFETLSQPLLRSIQKSDKVCDRVSEG